LRWYWGSYHGANLEPLHGSLNEAMTLGGIVHRGMASFLTGEYDDIYASCVDIVANEFPIEPFPTRLSSIQFTLRTLQEYFERQLLIEYEIVDIEKEHSVVIPNHHLRKDLEFVFVPDILLKHSTRGTYHLFDLKTTYDMPKYFDYLRVDEQCIGYPALLEHLYTGLEIESFTFLFLRTRPHRLPTMQSIRGWKDGYTPASVIFTLEQNGESVDSHQDYKDYLEYLSGKCNKFVHDEWLYPSKDQKSQFISDMINQTAEMHNPNLYVYPAPNRFCSSCPFFQPCANRGNLRLSTNMLAALFFNRNDAYKHYKLDETATREQQREAVKMYKQEFGTYGKSD
jgi:hypothetical protein